MPEKWHHIMIKVMFSINNNYLCFGGDGYCDTQSNDKIASSHKHESNQSHDSTDQEIRCVPVAMLVDVTHFMVKFLPKEFNIDLTNLPVGVSPLR